MNTALNKISALFITLLAIFGAFFPTITYAISSQELFEIVNEAREKQGLHPLLKNPLLEEAAFNKAQALFKNQEFAHNLPGYEFQDFVEETEYHYSVLGENLAIDFVTEQGVLNGWLTSPTHRANLLHTSFKEMGISVVEGKMHGKSTFIVVQLFGTPTDELHAQVAGYYDNVTEITQSKNFGLAAVIIGTATLEAGTAMSYLLYKITHRRKKRDD
jgi:hypothetical protein